MTIHALALFFFLQFALVSNAGDSTAIAECPLPAQCQKLEESFASAIEVASEKWFIPSLHLGRPEDKALIYAKAWMPSRIKPDTPVILFLHGNGYAISPDQPDGLMIEVAGLGGWFGSAAYQKNPAIVISIQDLFKDSEGRTATDYWLGRGSRSWEKFIAQELREFVMHKFPELENAPWLVAGISMGAHGAMKLAIDYPQLFSAFVSLSPIFRSTESEVPAMFKDSFLGLSSERQDLPFSLNVTSVGARILNDFSGVEKRLALVSFWIETHVKDFGLSRERFPTSATVWARLFGAANNPQICADESDCHVAQSNISIQSNPGHSMAYWRQRLPDALTWLLNSKGRTPLSAR